MPQPTSMCPGKLCATASLGMCACTSACRRRTAHVVCLLPGCGTTRGRNRWVAFREAARCAPVLVQLWKHCRGCHPLILENLPVEFGLLQAGRVAALHVRTHACMHGCVCLYARIRTHLHAHVRACMRMRAHAHMSARMSACIVCAHAGVCTSRHLQAKMYCLSSPYSSMRSTASSRSCAACCMQPASIGD